MQSNEQPPGSVPLRPAAFQIINPPPQALQVQALQGREQIQLPDITPELNQQRVQLVNEGFNRIAEGINARGEAEAMRAATSGNQSTGIANIIGAISEGIGIFAEIQAREDEAERAALGSAAALAIEDEILQLQNAIQEEGLETGITVTRSRIDRLFATQFQDLDPDTRTELYRRAMSALTEAEQLQTTRTFNALEDARSAQLGVRRQELTTALLGTLGGLQYAQGEDVQLVLNNAYDIMNQYASGLEPTARAELLGFAMEMVNGSLQGNVQAFAASQDVTNRLNQFNNGVALLREQGLDVSNPLEFQRQVNQLALSLNLEGVATREYTAYDISRQNFETLDLEQRMQLALTQGAIQNETVSQITSSDAANFLFSFINGGIEATARLEHARNSPNASIALRTAVRLYDEYSGSGTYSRTRFFELQRETESITSELLDLQGQIDPTLLGDQPFVQTDPITGEVRVINLPASARVPRAFRDQVEPLIRQRETLIQQTQEVVDFWYGNGLNILNPRDTERLDQLGAAAQAYRDSLPPPTATPPGQPGVINPSTGAAQPGNAAPLMTAFATPNNAQVLAPVAANLPTTITRDFAGGQVGDGITTGAHGYLAIDFDVLVPDSEDVPVNTFQGGTVIRADEWSGYGGAVLVRTPSGEVELFAHLRRIDVSVGQTLNPGTPLGLMGGGDNDPGRGTSTGRHIHFQVWRNQDAVVLGSGGLVNPYDYINNLSFTGVDAPGLGAPPNQWNAFAGYNNVPRDGTFLGNGLYYIGGMQVNLVTGETTPYVVSPDNGGVFPATSAISPTRPANVPGASIHRRDYPERNDPTNNYGYSVFRDDVAAARALAAAGDRLGIPAQWLADIMASESASFDPHEENYLGCIGMIQLCPVNFGSRPNWNPQAIRRMNRAQYIEQVVLPYLEGREYNTIEDVYAYIFGGAGLYNRSPQERARIGDGDITFDRLIDRIGAPAGRRYAHTFRGDSGGAIHVNFNATCDTCRAMQQFGGRVMPHTANISSYVLLQQMR